MVELGLVLEPIYEEINRKRQLANLKRGKEDPVQTSELSSTPDDANGDITQEAPGHTDDVVSKKVGLSKSKYQKGKKVLTEGSEEVKQAYKEDKISTNEAYHRTMGHEMSKPHDKEYSVTLPAFLYHNIIEATDSVKDNANSEIVCRHDGENILSIDVNMITVATSE